MAKTNSEKRQLRKGIIANYGRYYTGEKSLVFHTERLGGKPSSRSTQYGQRRLLRVTFLAEATRPANLIVVDQTGLIARMLSRHEPGDLPVRRNGGGDDE